MTYIVVSANEIVKAEMERPVPLPSEFAAPSPAMQSVINNYKAHCLSLPRIPAPGHKWKLWDEVVEEKDFRFGQTDCKLGREGCICFPYLEKWCSDAIYIAIPIQPTPEGEKVRCEYELAVIEYFGLPEDVSFNKRPNVIFADLVDLLAFFDQKNNLLTNDNTKTK